MTLSLSLSGVYGSLCAFHWAIETGVQSADHQQALQMKCADVPESFGHEETPISLFCILDDMTRLSLFLFPRLHSE